MSFLTVSPTSHNLITGVGRIFFAFISFCVASEARPTTSMAARLKASLPDVECSTIRLTGSEDVVPAPISNMESCQKALTKMGGTGGFWPALHSRESFESYYVRAGSKAAELCRTLLLGSGVTIDYTAEQGCVLGVPDASRPLAFWAYSTMTHGPIGPYLGIGSACIDLPIKEEVELPTTGAPIRQSGMLPSGANWNDLVPLMKAQGFKPSLFRTPSSRDRLIKSIWVVNAASNVKEIMFLSPAWLQVYPGEKEKLARQKWPCHITENCEAAEREYDKLKPERGLCFSFDGFGP